MTAPSRNMPAAPVHKVSWWAWLFLAALIAGLAYWFSQQPYFVGVLLVVLGGLASIQLVWDQRCRRQLAASRQSESICKFARSFSRQTDTWLIRAVYEDVSRYLSVDGKPIPVRQQDHCEKDLRIDPEDLEDITRDAAFRAVRLMEDCDKNPLFGKVQTVGDIVKFLEFQPPVAEPNTAPNERSSGIRRQFQGSGWDH